MSAFNFVRNSSCLRLLWVLVCWMLALSSHQHFRNIESFNYLSTPSCDFAVSELTSLQILYNNTNGESWLWQGNYQSVGIPWNFTAIPRVSSTTGYVTTNPCNLHWQGINCTYISDSTVSTGTRCSVWGIQLQGYNLTGSFGHTTWSFPHLHKLVITDNQYLFGQIPDDLMNVITLQDLSLYSNFLTGTIPLHIGNLQQLQTIKLYINYLTGRIPTSITTLSKLRILHLYLNELSGSIPSTLGDLTTLEDLGLESNGLTGNLPPSVTKLVHLTRLEVNENYLDGTIPMNIGLLNKLTFLQLYTNLFTGNLPSSLNNITTLNYMFVQENLFEGSIPSTIFSIPSLKKIFLYSNQFEETLEGTTLSSQMDSIDVHGNYLTGSVPVTWTNTPFMRFLYLDDNYFFGKIPSNIFGYNVSIVRLDNNLLIGTIPVEVGNAGLCRLLNVSYNYIHGTLPSSIRYLTRMNYFDVANNQLKGQVYDYFANMPNLIVLLLQNNQFSGPLYQLVNTSINPSLAVIDVSSNYFTGTIPSTLFDLKNLSIVAMVENCITGSLPGNICAGSDKLVTLAMDGLNTASICQSKFFPGVAQSKSYTLKQPLQGSIPSCLFENYPKLRTLHLSGNGISSSLPDITFINPSLQDLSLSHNQMIGTIPLILQQHPWSNLDLSFNKFTGELDTSIWSTIVNTENSYNTTSELHLDINRLSGDLPLNLRDVEDISILNGNLFDCDAKKSSLPKHDHSFHSYECGSNTVNNSIYIYITVFGVVIVFVVLLYRIVMRNKVDCYHIRDSMKYIGHQLIQCWEVYNSKEAAIFLDLEVEQLYGLGIMLKQFRKWIVSVTFVIGLIFIPTYLALTSYYSTYTFTYAWMLSSSYLSGTSPAITLLVLLTILLCLIYVDSLSFMRFNVYRLLEKISDKSRHLRDRNAYPSPSVDRIGGRKDFPPAFSAAAVGTEQQQLSQELDTRLKHTLLWVGMFLFNVITVLAVNMGYVLASTDRSINTMSKQTIAVVVSIYKIVWTSLLFEIFQRIIIKDIPKDHDVRENFYASFAAYMTWLSLFNNILAPCISVAIVSPDCFYYALFDAPEVDTSFEVSLCEVNFDETFFSMNAYCGDYTTLHTYYAPPFSYSYQCGSSLLAAFADVFIYRSLIAGLLVPLAIIVMKFAQEKSVYVYGAESKVYQLCTLILPDLYKPIPDMIVHRQQVQEVPVEASATIASSSPSSRSAANRGNDGDAPVLQMIIPAKIFKAENVFIGLITDVSVILTFGVIFPPIAILGCISSLCHSYFIQIAVGRLVVLARSQPILKGFISQVNDECKGIRGLLVRSLSSLSLLIAFVWSIFLFDTLGYQVGVYRAVWIVIVMMCIPLLVHAINLSVIWYQSSFRENSSDAEDEEQDVVEESKAYSTSARSGVEVEMATMSTIYSPQSKPKSTPRKASTIGNVVENPLRLSEDKKRSPSKELSKK